ncbi:hypothetical protein [Streptosporangium longisporum]|uniref:Uncharacterized protein n=1 Tax=Streptosporangium longisporum TaxID=46187 RepID=A0ABP6LAZ5_9ACTN
MRADAPGINAPGADADDYRQFPARPRGVGPKLPDGVPTGSKLPVACLAVPPTTA